LRLLGTERSLSTLHQDPSAISDALLVAAARSGDSHAFVELSRRHSRRILHKIYRITKNWQDAEDVLQDSLMKALIHLNTFQGRASFSTWLTTIAINTALMLLRKQKGVVKSTIDGILDDGTPSDKWELRDRRETPEQHYERQQRSELLQEALLRLQPASRQIVEMYQTGELSTREIAQSLGVSEATVKSRMWRAKKVLRTFVQEDSARYHAFSAPPSAVECGMD